MADRDLQRTALTTLRRLIKGGFAGVDEYDHTLFVIDAATQDDQDAGDVACDLLGGSALRPEFFRMPSTVVMYRLPEWARRELGLDGAGAPTVCVPLCSRRAVA